ncbi:hypothetical protein OCGS_1647 [Oceaniovalibus guishaninsula JLT2003]|uniref:Uncharacterized protein n=1 Tax=Oceaniovalibus guishaninsula JLT2003 TaxID=1231392 RepID=K2GNC3_9RHOB|nr:hypothetical protein [Oceaniovalibus guishaninsula]EKE44131.1 hypothetical protein OCGS_1647 [Oceaniovalibus guishaninsula JLT2003]
MSNRDLLDRLRGVWRRRAGADLAGTVAGGLAVLWAVAAAMLLVWPGNRGLGDTIFYVTVPIAVLLPLALAWVGITVGRAARHSAAALARLTRTLDAIERRAGVAPAQPDTPDLSARLDRIADTQRKIEATLARLAATRADRPAPAASAPAAPQRAAADTAQPALGIDAPQEAPALGIDDLIAALQFPVDPQDRAGFRALRRALQDRSAAQVVTSAQDVLTLLSQDGIYMDDLPPDAVDPALWRRFARGERGPAIAGIGAIREEAALDKARRRMRGDTIFRDTCHHFLRLFDRTLAGMEPQADDAQIARLANTRTARAFMLLGRVAGTFD